MYLSLKVSHYMMMSSNGNIFHVTGHLCGEFTGHRWIPHTNGQWRWALMFSFICAWINSWVNNCEAGDLRRHCAHYDVMAMIFRQMLCKWATIICLTNLHIFIQNHYISCLKITHGIPHAEMFTELYQTFKIWINQHNFMAYVKTNITI